MEQKITYEKRTYSVSEAAHVLGISTQLMYPLTRSKGFPLLIVGQRRKLIPIKAFHEWIEKQVEGGNYFAD